jgi:small subunit ribosomal protein S7
MPRKGYIRKREILPDPKYKSVLIARFINKILLSGKKETARQIVYGSFNKVFEKIKKDPVGIFEEAIKNASPILEVKSRRIGGANYQIPFKVEGDRQSTLAMRWIITAARAKKGKSMTDKLASEFMEAASGTGAAIKKKEDTHKMAEANKAFAHYARF